MEKTADTAARPAVEYPLSSGQRAIWLLNQIDPQSSAYNVNLSFRVRSTLDVRALRRALRRIVERHAPLRSTFHERAGAPVQRVGEPASFGFEHVDARGWDPADMRLHLLEAANRPYDLEHGPVLRVVLVSAGPGDHLLLVGAHHLVTDMWSTIVLMEELSVLYPAERLRATAHLPPLPVEYAEFVRWQGEMLEGAEGDAHWSYWSDALSGELPPLELPTDRLRPAIQTFTGATLRFRVEEERVARLHALARAEKVTFYTLLLASFQALLHRYSRQETVIVGSPVAARSRPEFETLIGYFVNPLVFRADFSGDPSVLEFLGSTGRAVVGGLEHQDFPFPALVERLRPPRDPRRSPVFQAMLSFERPHRLDMRGSPAFVFGEEGTRRMLGDLDLEPIVLDARGSQFDLTLAVHESAGALHAAFEYNSELFDRPTIARMAAHYGAILDSMAEDPARRVSELSLLAPGERRTLEEEWSGEGAVPTPAGTIWERLAAAARERGEAPAVESSHGTLTFARLVARSERLAAHLRSRGVGPGTIVGVLTGRSPEAVVGFLAVLRAGGTYLPLDPALPRKRLEFLLDDARPALVLAPRGLEAVTRHRVPCVPLDAEEEGARSVEDRPAGVTEGPRPEDAAYVIYTSGSAGLPKGVRISHHGLLNHAVGVARAYQLRPGDRVLQFASWSFDVAAEETFPSLISGATVVLRPEGDPPAITELARWLADRRITVVNLPASYWRQWADELERDPALLPPSVRLVVAGSERVRPESLARWKRSAPEGTRLLNAYGPSEATITATVYDTGLDSPRDRINVAIGRPLPGVRVHVLDAGGRTVPIGVPGEAHIGGPGVAIGYLDRPDLDRERFVRDPFAHGAGARLYRTGDLVRWRADGNLEFLGRLDDQVKIRGFRVEPGEIEAALLAHPAVADAAVIPRERQGGSLYLVAYVAWAPGAPPAPDGDLRAFLGEKLPAYMVPAAIVGVGSLPRGPGGKIVARELPVPGDESLAPEREETPPRTPAEVAIAGIWAETLGRPRVGVLDNFFSLGGDSILAIQVVARARRRGLRLTTRQLFQHPTVAGLAAAAEKEGACAAEQGIVSGEAPLTPIQRWLLDRNPIDPHHDNQSVLLALRESPDVAALGEAVRRILLHHDVLRSRFENGGGVLRQVVAHAAAGDSFARIDLSRVNPSGRAAALEETCAEVQASLDLGRGPLFRAVLFDSDRQEQARLLLVAHHLVVDGVSWRILLEDLAALYEQLRRGETPALPPKTTSFRSWALRLSEHARSDAVLAEAGFWTQERRTRARRLPLEGPSGVGSNSERESGDPGSEASARTIRDGLTQEETRVLLRIAAGDGDASGGDGAGGSAPPRRRARMDDLLLGALARALATWGGPGPWLVDLEGHGREEIFDDVDLSRTVGWFTTMYPVVLEAGPGVGEPVAGLDAVRRELGSIPGHGLGYGLLRHLSPDGPAASSVRRLPDAPICFNYLGQLDRILPDDGPFTICDEPLRAVRSPRAGRTHVLEVNAMISDARLQVSWTYDQALHDGASVARISALFLDGLRSLLASRRISAGGRESEEVYPLSPLQLGMLFHSLDDDDPGAYVEQLSWVFEGDLDVPALRSAWAGLVDRHPALRTAFLWDGLDQPVQAVQWKADPPWTMIDLRGLDAEEQAWRLDDFLRAERARPFELARAPLLRFALVRTEERETHFVMSHHHLILDGWSVPILLDELADLYRGAGGGAAPALGPATSQREYIEWLRSRDGGDDPEPFWRETLRGFRSPTTLRLEPPDPAGARETTAGEVLLDARYAEQRRVLPAAATEALQAYARAHALTLGTIVSAAWALLLSRYSGEEDVVFGRVASGRPAELPGAETAVGLFINTVPLRLPVPARSALLPWLEDVQRRHFDSLRYEHTPLSDVQGWSEVPRGTPLFESILIVENFPIGDRLADKLDALGIRRFRAWDKTNYPISVAAAPGPGLSLQIVYDVRRFEADAMSRVLGHLATLLESIPAQEGATLRELPMLASGEKDRLPTGWRAREPRPDASAAGAPTRRYPERCIHELLEEQAEMRPEATAVVAEHVRMTYAELAERAEALASRLRALGVGGESAVALCAERSPEAIVGMLAVLKAGGAYASLDPAYPAERLAFMLEDLGARVVLTQRRLLSRLPEHGATVVLLDDLESLRAATGSTRSDGAAVTAGPDRLAYIMYTSGSTGLPKGVEVTHRGVVRLVRDTDWIRFGPDETVLQVVSLSFDPSALEIWGCLLNGGCLVLHPSRTPSLEEIGEALREHRVTTVVLITGLFPLMVAERLDDLRGLRQLIVGGDVMPPEAARRVLEEIPGLRLINAYGPTEGTVVACAHTVADASEIGKSVPIGRPIAHTRVHLLDRNLDPVPPGIPGEIVIGGDGVARGYRGRPELTAERFPPDPWGGPGARLYRTGDLARHRSDGTIEFLGRLDDQVKIRGFRIEPGEIEAALARHPSVHECAVLARRDAPGERRLVAYVTPADGAPLLAGDMRAFLRRSLPEFMIPAALVTLERFPLTANGKLDRAALPAPGSPAPGPGAARAGPTTRTESEVASVWGEILRSTDPGIDEDFFEAGGHSLLATQLVSRLRARFGPVVSLRDVHATPTIRGLAARIEMSRPAAGGADESRDGAMR